MNTLLRPFLLLSFVSLIALAAGAADTPTPLQELADLPTSIDHMTAALIHRLSGRVQPWMWWLGGVLWGALVLLIGRLVERAVRRVFPKSRSSWLGKTFRAVCYVICALAAVYLFLHAFGAAILAGPLLRVEGKLVLLAVMFGIADLSLLGINLAIDRYLDRVNHADKPVEHSARVRTLLPLMRTIAMAAVGILLLLLVLGELGINIAPLLAGAGVVGVAIGFGAQKLVADLFTGAFMLFENTLAIGDLVQIGDHMGTVEGLTIRTLRLRDPDGLVHTLPFSSVTAVINMSRDFSYYSFSLNVAIDADIEKAMALIAAVVASLHDDPITQADVLGPVDTLGVNKIGEGVATLTGRVRTRPGRQFAVGRAFNRAVLVKFREAGLPLGLPTRMIHVIQDVGQAKSSSADS